MPTVSGYLSPGFQRQGGLKKWVAFFSKESYSSYFCFLSLCLWGESREAGHLSLWFRLDGIPARGVRQI